MIDYRRYQPRRSGGQPSRWRRLVLGAAVILVVFFIGKGIFGRGKTAVHDFNQNSDGITLVNDANTNAADANSNTNSADATNTNADSNTNTSVASTGIESFSDNFSLDICKTPIATFGKAKFAALTFDLSAANDGAQKVLDMLKQKSARASFFSTGTFAEKNKEFVAKVAKAGFGVYNHGYESKNYSQLSNDEVTTQITKADTAIEAATGDSSKPLLRPPYGDYDADVISAAKTAGYCVVLWTVDAFDWKSDITAAESKQRVLDKAVPGMIVALHAGYDVTAEMLPDLIDKLRAGGYTLVSLPTLLQQ